MLISAFYCLLLSSFFSFYICLSLLYLFLYSGSSLCTRVYHICFTFSFLGFCLTILLSFYPVPLLFPNSPFFRASSVSFCVAISVQTTWRRMIRWLIQKSIMFKYLEIICRGLMEKYRGIFLKGLRKTSKTITVRTASQPRSVPRTSRIQD
jgi:hypothetical protein